MTFGIPEVAGLCFIWYMMGIMTGIILRGIINKDTDKKAKEFSNKIKTMLEH